MPRRHYERDDRPADGPDQELDARRAGRGRGARAARRTSRGCRSSTSWVAAMPDVHLGIGATVGSVIPTQGRDHPGGGRRRHRLRHDGGADDAARRATCPTTCAPMRTAIERAVPHGRGDHGGKGDTRRVGAIRRAASSRRGRELEPGFERIVDKHPQRSRSATTSMHLGTLGTGNHFIEVCLDEADRVWFMLHSGSRGVGNRIGSYFIELAKEDMRRHIHQPAGRGPRLLPGGQRALRRLRRGGAAGRRTSRAHNRELMMDAVLDARAQLHGHPAVPDARRRRSTATTTTSRASTTTARTCS